jgi:hypothetical protein
MQFYPKTESFRQHPEVRMICFHGISQFFDKFKMALNFLIK